MGRVLYGGGKGSTFFSGERAELEGAALGVDGFSSSETELSTLNTQRSTLKGRARKCSVSSAIAPARGAGGVLL
jgi:hypothetical protein